MVLFVALAQENLRNITWNCSTVGTLESVVWSNPRL